nr:reverse transcriptase domain-containing protein [Tanacetum cinerariifolium]
MKGHEQTTSTTSHLPTQGNVSKVQVRKKQDGVTNLPRTKKRPWKGINVCNARLIADPCQTRDPLRPSNRNKRNNSTLSRKRQTEEGTLRKGSDLGMPEPGPEARNQGAAVPNHQGRKIQKEERCSNDWQNVCFIGSEIRKRICPHIQKAWSGIHTTLVVGTLLAVTKVLTLKKQKFLSRNVATRESIRKKRKQCQKVKEVQEGNWKSKPKKQKSSVEDDLSQPWEIIPGTLPSTKKCIKDPVEIHNIKQRDMEYTKEFVRRIPKSMDEMMSVTTIFLRGKVEAFNPERKKSAYHRQVYAPKKENKRNAKKLSHLIKELKQNHGKDQSKKGGNLKKRQTTGNINDTAMTKGREEDGTEGPMIIEAEIGGHCVHRMYVDGGDEEHSTSALMNFMVVRSPSPYNGIIGRPGGDLARLVDKAFQRQIGRNLEVYVDDLVIKSRTKNEVIRDIEETFKTLRKINMKLNPKKCAFGMREGAFLGYKVDANGLRVCSDKVEAVLSLTSPKCLKDVQKLNGKVASLNRFLSKSTEKFLPFFKTLKKCTKKSGFQWTIEAEMAFKEMKQLIAELPMLTAPKEKEELIIYLAAAKEAISAVLMTERDEKQVPNYFVSVRYKGQK